MSDKKISELSAATSINQSDVSILVSGGVDYKFAFSTLLQFLSINLAVGANISFGVILPQNTLGKNGDVFINTTTGSFAQKISGTWNIVYTLPSVNSLTDGTVLYGLGVPGTSIGNNNDTYIDTGTGIFYKKAAGSWGQVFSMQTGPQGPQGTAGTNGTNGINGFTILNGGTDPSNLSTGVNGDFYINTSNYTFFGPKIAGAWPEGVSLVPPGVIAGGFAGHALTKASDNDYDTEWVNLNGLYIRLDGSYSSPSWINSLDWTKISSKPTTIAGYGITDFNTLGDARWLQLSGGTLTGDVQQPVSPVNANSLINKNYVDNLITGLTWKKEVKAGTISNITLSGIQTIDSIALVAGDRVLVKNQTTQSQNGIYVVASGSWIRTTDADTTGEIEGATVMVRLGTVNKDTQWTNTNSNEPVIGTDAITFGQIAGAGTYTNGTGINLTANVFGLDLTYTDATYLKLDGSNANTTINLGTQGISTSGPVTFGNQTGTVNAVILNGPLTNNGQAFFNRGITMSDTASVNFSVAASGVSIITTGALLEQGTLTSTSPLGMYGYVSQAGGWNKFVRVSAADLKTFLGLSANYVPYTGATANVDLGSANISTAGIITTNASVNLYIPTFQGIQSVNQTPYQFASSTSNFIRTAFNGGSAAGSNLTSGAFYSGAIFGNFAIGTFTSGTHPWLANVVITPLNITSNGATITNTANLYIGAASTLGTNNYSLYSGGTIAVNKDALGTTVTDGLLLSNTTASTSFANTQFSPALHFSGTRWTGSASQQIETRMSISPDASNINIFKIDFRLGGTGGYSDVFYISNGGAISMPGIVSVGGQFTGGIIVANTYFQGSQLIGFAGTTLAVRGESLPASTNFTATKLYNFTAHTNSSGVMNQVSIEPNYNQTGTAGSIDLLINRTETALGSGTHLIADFRVGGVSKFKIDRTGLLTVGKVYTSGDLSALGSGVSSPDGMGAINVTMPTDANSYAMFGMTRLGGTACAIGMSATNNFIIGTGTGRGNGSTIDTTLFSLNTATGDIISVGIIVGKTLRSNGYLVANLPAGGMGDIAYATDASVTTRFSTVVGGGSTVIPVFFNGSNWICI